MSKNIVFEGWLTKSPPSKRIWRTKWRRRWFALRQSGELPGQYFLDYYADRNCRRLKGTINLDLCEQVDAGLRMERTGNGTIDPKLRGSVFTIQTQTKTYHLEADCEAEMEKWVDAICRVCGLRATDESSNVLKTYQTNVTPMTAMNENYECADGTGPYIPISECITGVRAQDEQRAFTFDPKNIVVSTRTPFETVTDNRTHQMYVSQPHIRLNNTDCSENESNLSDEECKSLNASQSNIRDWSVAKSFTKLAISPKRNGLSEDGLYQISNVTSTIPSLETHSTDKRSRHSSVLYTSTSENNYKDHNNSPPVPPRPPKTFTMSRDFHKDTYQGPKIQEPIEAQENVSPQSLPWLRVPRRMSHGASSSPGRSLLTPAVRTTDDEEEYSPGHLSMQYCNLPSLPPAVDRALKPRHSSRSIGHINHLIGLGLQINANDDMKADALQYLDLDLHTSKPTPTKAHDPPRRRSQVAQDKTMSSFEADSAYKTVDFLKTEAFNITRQDAEASRSNHH